METATAPDALSLFHEDVRSWFQNRFKFPTEGQAQAWPLIAAGGNVLLAAPTGSGKTLAAFLWAVDRLWRRGLEEGLPHKTQVLYISPLKALSHDVKKNLEEPLREIRARSLQEHLREVDVTLAVRTGDTSAAERESMRKQPPHIFITTPESLFLLLTSTRGRALLQDVETVIVDEVHALAGNRRGAHLALSLERLQALTERPLQRIGLSATQKPLELVANFLVGDRDATCSIVDVGRRRDFDLQVEIPSSGLSAVMELEVWEEVYARLLVLIAEHRTTLIFTGTRRMAERIAHRLRQTLGDDAVAAHHGSMSRERRHDAEQRLKAGTLRAMAATSSLELGIDIGSVDLVVQIGSPKSINAFLQRAGRSRHHVGGIPKARLFPLTRDELVEAAALLRALRQGELDALWIPEAPLDMLAQQIVAEVACREWGLDSLYAVLRRAHPYRNLSPERFLEIVQILAQGYTTRRGRRGAHIHFDAVNHRLRGRPGARLTALLNGGAIPDAFDYEVRLEPGDQFLGTVHEDFAIESMSGDVFLLGNGTWRILRVEENAVRVADAKGEAPSLPFWLGEAPSRSAELCAAISDLRRELEIRLGDPKVLQTMVAAQGSAPEAPWKIDAALWLREETGFTPEAANGIVDHLASGFLALGTLPKQEELVAERFFDSGGDMHLVLHCPYGSRVNRAFGLALRKRFCRKFNFELQAAATEEGLILSLGATHSFPLEEVFQYLNSNTVRGLLQQAVLDSPMFEVRWRWNATRFLAIARRRGGKRVPAILQRLDAQDLVALVFPDQIACAENILGDREIPDHPLVRQTLDDCLHEAMDIEGLEALLRRIENGSCRVTARDVSEPSPLAQELLQARPYAFLDGAPLEERRTRAVTARSSGDPAQVTPASLDAEAVMAVTEEAWPSPRDPDELHDALLTGGFLTEGEIRAGSGGDSWQMFLEPLIASNRIGSLSPSSGQPIWVASERWAEARRALPDAVPVVTPVLPESLRQYSGAAEEALRDLIRSRLEIAGPVSEAQLADPLGISVPAAGITLLGLESEGFVFRGDFRPGPKPQWCERRLLFRMRQRSVSHRRKSVVTVPATRFQEFLFGGLGVFRVGARHAEPPRGSPETLNSVLEILEGFEAPGELWEKEILQARVPDYDPAWLDLACQSGRFGFGRLRPPKGDGPLPPFLSLRYMPLAFFPRQNLRIWKRLGGAVGAPENAPTNGPTSILREILQRRGAIFADELFSAAAAAGVLPEETERGLRALIHAGLAAGDGFSALRGLWRPLRRARSSSGWKPAGRLPSAFPGRFFLFPAEDTPLPRLEVEEMRLHAARILLRRYGVVFRALAQRETVLPPWRELRLALRTLEDRGEARGGRFITGVAGEQFASPDALEMLYREAPFSPEDPAITLCSHDPANLQGILTPERRGPLHPKNRILFLRGVPQPAT